MTREPRSDRNLSAAVIREQRLKAALKANMGRRKDQAKAQARARAEAGDAKPGAATEADNDKG